MVSVDQRKVQVCEGHASCRTVLPHMHDQSGVPRVHQHPSSPKAIAFLLPSFSTGRTLTACP